MRLLRINGSNVDIDEQTAIGIDLQSYDIKNPGVKKINVSNTFTIPLTATNLHIIGNPQDPQSQSTATYDLMTCDYWIGNDHVIEAARVRVGKVKERIEIFLFEKRTIWDELKEYYWTDFISEYLTWLQEEKSVPSEASPFVDTFTNFITPYADLTLSQNLGIFLPFYLGNLFAYRPDSGSSETPEGASTNTIRLRYQRGDYGKILGGHFCTYVKTIFEFLEYKYSVNFLVNETANGNIWADPIASTEFIPIREFDVRMNTSGLSGVSYYFEIGSEFGFISGLSTIFSPLTDTRDKAGKTMYELVSAFMQRYNIVKDEFYLNGERVIRLARFDDLPTSSNVVDWSGKIKEVAEFTPYIEGFAQNNIIKHKSIFENGDELQSSRNITSLNQNIDARTDLFEIDNHIPAFTAITGGVIPDLSAIESFKTFIFFTADGLTTDNITIYIRDLNLAGTVVEESASLKLYKPALYSLSSEYVFFESIIQYPKVYSIKKWLSLKDIYNFEFFKEYWIQELGASFFVNKIKGFNPDKSNEPTTIELIRTGNRKPLDIEGLELYVDADVDLFTDGTGDTWY